MNTDHDIRLDINQIQRMIDMLWKEHNQKIYNVLVDFNDRLKLMYDNINTDFSQSLSVTFRKIIKSFHTISHELEDLLLQGNEAVSKETSEKTAKFIENTTSLLEENGIDSSQIQELNTIKNKKSFTPSEIIGIIIAIISLTFQIVDHFSQKDTTVNNYNQNITINYNNSQEKEKSSSTLDETRINQICDYLSRNLESLLTLQEDSTDADSPLPDAKTANDIPKTT